jgi:ABC-type lipoprotein release transport system permease subunit
MLFIKKIVRDLYKNKSRSFSIVILIFLSIAILVFYAQPGAVLGSTYSQMKIDSNKADIVIDSLPFDSDIFNNSVYEKWMDKYDITHIQPRLFFKGEIEIDNSFKINSHIIGLPDEQRPSVNNIITPNNDYFSNDPREGFIERSYVESYSISESTQLNVSISESTNTTNFPIVFKNTAHSIEYPFIENAGGGYERSTLVQELFVMSVFINISYLQELLFLGEEIYNQICLKFENPSNKLEFIRDLRKDDSRASSYILDIKDPTDILEETTTIMYLVGWMIGILLFVISLFLIYTTLSRFIEEQKPQIGTLKALGYSNSFIIRHYVLYGFFMTLIGSILGLLTGLILGSLLVDPFIKISFSIPYIVYSIPIVQYTLAFFLILACAIIVCLFESLSTVKITPQLAVKPEIMYLSQKKSLFEKLLIFFKKGYRLSPNSKYFVRKIFSRPKRTVTVGISVIGAIIIATVSLTLVGGIVNTSYNLIDSIHYDGQIYFNKEISLSEANEFIDTNSLTSYEPFFLNQGRLIYEDGSWINIGAFRGLPMNSLLHEFSTRDNLFQNNRSAIVTVDLARILDIQEGEQYFIQGNNKTSQSITIQEIKKSYIETSFLIPFDLALLLSNGDSTKIEMTGMLVTVGNDFEREKIESTQNVQTVLMKNDLKDILSANFDTITAVSYLLVLAAFFFGLMIIFSIMNINITERKNDFHIMKSIGINNRQIYLFSSVEAIFYGIIGSLGYIIGFFISVNYQEILAAAMTMPLANLQFSIQNFAFLIIFGTLMTFFSQFLALRIVLKQKIAEVTKEKLFG